MLDGTQIFKLNNEVVDQNKIILRSVYRSRSIVHHRSKL